MFKSVLVPRLSEHDHSVTANHALDTLLDVFEPRTATRLALKVIDNASERGKLPSACPVRTMELSLLICGGFQSSLYTLASSESILEHSVIYVRKMDRKRTSWGVQMLV